MIRLQDIAEMAGVSRTTVSNVINGNTKRVSQKTIDKITTILKEQNYVPHMGSVMLSGPWFQNYRCSTRIFLCPWYAVTSGSICGRTDRNDSDGKRKKMDIMLCLLAVKVFRM